MVRRKQTYRCPILHIHNIMLLGLLFLTFSLSLLVMMIRDRSYCYLSLACVRSVHRMKNMFFFRNSSPLTELFIHLSDRSRHQLVFFFLLSLKNSINKMMAILNIHFSFTLQSQHCYDPYGVILFIYSTFQTRIFQFPFNFCRRSSVF